MIQASRRSQLVAKEGCVKAGASASTMGCSEPIMIHMGEPLDPGGPETYPLGYEEPPVSSSPAARFLLASCSVKSAKVQGGKRAEPLFSLLSGSSSWHRCVAM